MADSIGVQPFSSKPQTSNRWGIALAGVIMQIALGAVYAWSVFRIPLTKAFGWTISQVTFTFTLAILMLGFAAAQSRTGRGGKQAEGGLGNQRRTTTRDTFVNLIVLCD